MTTWFIRIAGWLVLYISLRMMEEPVVAIMDIIPFLGDLVGSGLFSSFQTLSPLRFVIFSFFVFGL
jgi:hypothetical protein